VAAVGPVENLPDYNRIRSSMYWLRVWTEVYYDL